MTINQIIEFVEFDQSVEGLRETLEEFASDSYIMGYDDRRIEEEEERAYYAGFSAYGKREDWE